jgi:TPR repeat protein
MIELAVQAAGGIYRYGKSMMVQAAAIAANMISPRTRFFPECDPSSMSLRSEIAIECMERTLELCSVDTLSGFDMTWISRGLDHVRQNEIGAYGPERDGNAGREWLRSLDLSYLAVLLVQAQGWRRSHGRRHMPNRMRKEPMTESNEARVARCVRRSMMMRLRMEEAVVGGDHGHAVRRGETGSGEARSAAGDSRAQGEIASRRCEVGETRCTPSVAGGPGFVRRSHSAAPSRWMPAIGAGARAAVSEKSRAQRLYDEAWRLYPDAGSAKHTALFAQKAADLGHGAAHFLSAWCLMSGRGTPKDERAAVASFRRSMECGNVDGKAGLGLCLVWGSGVPRDCNAGAALCREAAEAGSGWGAAFYGVCLLCGYGVREDDIASLEWFRKGAEQGCAYAAFRLGFAFDCGHGIRRNRIEAAQWYRKAAQGEDREGMYYLGECRRRGKGVAQSLAEAGRWLRLAATAGDGLAWERCRRLGIQHSG